jgi:hypothetical protein
MLDAPLFTSPLDPDIAGDDPLGLAPVNERLYNAVFPGINNVVRYIRVYSSLCWVVHQVEKYFQQHQLELSKGDALRIANEAYEKVQLILTWINKEKGYTQLAGTGRQFPTDDRKIRFVFASFGQSSASLLEAVSYRPSLTTGLGFLDRKQDGTYACTEAGLALASAFDSHVRTSPKYRWLSDITKLEGNRAAVFELESSFDVGAATEAEQAAFLTQFFPTSKLNERDQLTQNRWLSLHLTLRAIQACNRSGRAQGNSSYATELEIRSCMASGRTSNGDVLNLKGIESVQVWWSVLQLRQLHRLALDLLFSCTEQWLDDRNMEGKLVSLDECVAAIGNSALTGLDTDYASDVASLWDYYKDVQGEHPTLYVSAACTDTEDDSANLFPYVEELLSLSPEFDEDGANEAVSSAYVALIFCACEVRNLLQDPTSKEAILRDQDQCSLLALARLAEKMRNATPTAFVSYLIRHWVILRHFQVVCDRSQNADGKNRFRFVLGENGLERFNPAVRITEPAFAQDKLMHVLYLLEQSGLLSEKNGGYTLTPQGRTRLGEYAK